jgi:D-serine/D-alanine/glycine transporter
MAGFQTAVFAFVGMEIVGTTAAEVKNPQVVMPRAINTIPIRILMFYLGTLAVLMMVTPWQRISSESSPFVGMFALAGFAGAASIVNFVVVTSALSSTNSGIYSTSRMLYGLSWHHDASKVFRKLSTRGVPANGLLLAAILLLSAAALLAAGGSIMDAFQMVGAVASLLFIYVWTIILLCYLAYRNRRRASHAASTFKMPAGRLMCYVVLTFFAILMAGLAFDSNTRVSLLILPVWFLLLAAAYFGKIRKQPEHIERRAMHTAKVADELAAARRFSRSSK